MDQGNVQYGYEQAPYNTRAYSNLEVVQYDDGLQVAGSDGKEYVPPVRSPFDGLGTAGAAGSQFYRTRADPEVRYIPNPNGVVPYDASSLGYGQKQAPTRPWWKKRRNMVVMAAILAVAIVVAVVPSVVTSHRGVATPSQAGSQGSSATPQPPGRVRSTSGAWNGTALSAAAVDEDSGYLIYQRANGSIRFNRFTLVRPSMQLAWQNATVMTQEAADGTPVYSHPCVSAGPCDLQTFFVAKNGTLVDLVMPSIKDFRWNSGNISQRGFKAPTDGRVVLKTDYQSSYAQVWNAPRDSMRLFAGGLDGAVHQYLFAAGPYVWTPSGTIIKGTNAYGAIFTRTGGFVGGQASTFMLNTLQDGTVQALWSVDANSTTETTTFPTGNWSAPVVASTVGKAAVNTSMIYSDPYGGSPFASMMFPNQAGNLVNVSIDLEKAYSGQTFEAAHAVDRALPIMQGSDLGFLQWSFQDNSSVWVIFYQQNGSDISWMTFNGSINARINQGTLATDD